MMNWKEKLSTLGGAMLYSPLEILVREVTSNEPYLPKETSKDEIARATFNSEDCNLIMNTLWKRTEELPKNHRIVHKGLQLLMYLIEHGSEACVDSAKSNVGRLKILSNSFSYFEDPSKKQDLGEPVRGLAAALIKLINDDVAISELRRSGPDANKSQRSHHLKPQDFNSLSKNANIRSQSMDFHDNIQTPPKSNFRSPPGLSRHTSTSSMDNSPLRFPPQRTPPRRDSVDPTLELSLPVDPNLIAELDKIKKENETLKKNESQYKSENLSLQSQIDTLQSELYHFRAPIEHPVKPYVKPEFHDPRLNQTREQRLSIQNETLQREIKSLQSKSQQHQQDMEECEQRAKHAQEQLDKIRQELDNSLAKKEQELKGLLQNVSQVERKQSQEIELLRLKNESQQSDLSESKRLLEECKQMLSSERLDREKEVSERGEELDAVKMKCSTLEAERNEAKVECENLKTQLGQDRITLSVTREQVDELSNGLKQALQENELSNQALLEMKGVMQIATSEIEELKEQLTRVKLDGEKSLMESKQEQEGLLKQIHQLGLERESLQQDYKKKLVENISRIQSEQNSLFEQVISNINKDL
ncbi:epsin [Acrasis kona]|uniref:Epsin n=1 Tax=Acrasis kona TaxID=1008807 RepID=A0AAW2Z754_9EUKA